MREEPTITQIISMTEDEAYEWLSFYKEEIRKNSKTFYSRKNRNGKGQPISGGDYHYHLQGMRDWLNMKLNGNTDLLTQIAKSRGEV